NNYAALVLVAHITEAVSAAAAGVSLDFRPSGTADVSARLEQGELDLAIGGFAAGSERFSDMRVLEDSYVAVVRCGHPAA
ncbi:LysR substrate-binding domain-containing protein, partial [Pseudomonas aeruginosa]